MHMNKKMKRRVRIVILALSVFLSLCLTGCGSKERVPDSYIDAEIQYFIKNKNFRFLRIEPESYSFSVEHSPDKSMHTDNVSVSIDFQFPYGTATYFANGSYQYMRNNDVWDGSIHIQTTPSFSLNEKKLCTTHEMPGATITVSSLDLKKETITCEYSFNAYVHTGVLSGEYRQIEGSGTFPLEKATWSYISNRAAYSFTIAYDGEETTFCISPDYGIEKL